MQYKEVVELPSQGVLYSDKLKSVEVTLITTEQEKVLYGSNSELVMDELLKACILTPGVDVDNLLVQDKIYLLYQLRASSYDEVYSYNNPCSVCKKLYKAEVNLLKLPNSTLPLDFIEPIEVTLPKAKNKVSLKLLRGKDEKSIADRIKQMSKIVNTTNVKGLEYVTALAKCVVSIDGNSISLTEAETFINNLLAKDAAAIRRAIENVKFGYDTEITDTCPHCRAQNQYDLPLGREFFRPN